ncbi:alpha/beta fold hydrolase [Asticcacaulis sp. YBE204]|uniref:lipase family alpha/beta hydrolase n=1 Tax=Asticcacaulis sp. YBE204 TaxID=1282363 RepID=UPI0003C3FBD5|nr:alpha/beta fold hydrolase [Asticcacaulis sp. YBE204]ESQ79382.1 hypothetical protein AEYBE204_10255 [Asticcacaulis sp. YBE204]
MTRINERVVLIHGLAETPFHMRSVAQAARAAGYGVAHIIYPSTRAPIETLIADHVTPQIADLTLSNDKVHFVTHSLGGVLLHAYLQIHRPANLGRVVMQAPGLEGSETLEMFRRNPIFRFLFGPAAYQSGTGTDGFAARLPRHVDYELGVIAGCVSLDLLPLFFVPPPHDGKISVGRTKLEGMADHIVLPTSHDTMMHDPAALFQTLRFLHCGHFLHLLRPANAPRHLAA